MASERTVLVAGAGGLVGRAVIEHYLARGNVDVIALSRHPPIPHTGARFIAVDLTDAAGCAARLGDLTGVTHIVYAALYEKPDLTQGWLEQDQIATNLGMLTNLMAAIEPRNRGLRHITLLQGAKAYGVHLGQISVPARESAPRHIHPNFYWAQEDFLAARQAGKEWGWTIFRPQVVFGFAIGSMMNMIAAIGAYAAISRELGLPLIYPGTGSRVTEATDARLLARAIDWAGGAAAAFNQTFNITNGDVFTWEGLWPAVARAFALPLGLPQAMPLAHVMPGHGETWRALAARHRLEPVTLEQLIRGSWQFADFAFSRPHSTASLLSTIKLRQAGFGDCIDTEASLTHWLGEMQRRNVLPATAA
ncbi:MAG: SDR family oxidoreductase [Acidibrevibacterium sp.]|uniref:SDR family oxidoreductase n=1 Tax=Acidibrevibacterium sp. TaxID=2606776 RepID=UPI003CFC918A